MYVDFPIPNWVTIFLVKLYTFCRSSDPPELISPKNIYYEVIPPNIIATLSVNSFLAIIYEVFGKYWAYPKEPFDLGMIVNFTKGSPPFKNQLETAWPASW